MSDEARVKIKPVAAHLMGVMSGLGAAVEVLKTMPKSARQLPGFALAEAAIAAEYYQSRAECVQKNLAAIAKAGHDVALHKAISFDPMTSELICEFYQPDLLDEE